MTHDELRKRAFELECALGKSIKLNEQMHDEITRNQKLIGNLVNINTTLINSIRNYMTTMNKNILLNGIDTVEALTKNLHAKGN